MKEKGLCPDTASRYRELAMALSLDTKNLCFGATYVPVDVAIDLGLNKFCNVVWDEQDPIRTVEMRPAFQSIYILSKIVICMVVYHIQ